MDPKKLLSDPQIKLKVEAEVCRRSFYEFVKRAWHLLEPAKRFVDNWHLKVICDHLQAAEEGKLRKLIINVPPRTGKSTIVSILYPAWLWIRNPAKRILLASFSHALAEQLSRKRRDFVLKSDWFGARFGELFKLSDHQSRKSEYENDKTGSMIATSVGGTVTGRGGDILLLDDPQDPEQAASDVERQNTIDWLISVWGSRGNDPTTPQILIQQRLHERDATGVYLEQDDWVHLKIPMLYELNVDIPETPLGYKDPRTEESQTLDAIRFPPHYVEEMKSNIIKERGSYIWSGQYQQTPAPAEGAIIRRQWLQPWEHNDLGQVAFSFMEDTGASTTYRVDPDTCMRFCTVDPAITERTAGEKKQHDPDYTVFASWMLWQSKRGPCLFLLDLKRERMSGNRIVTELQQFHKQWRFNVIGVETTAFQLIVFQEAKKRGLPVREMSRKKDALYVIDTDKIGRVHGALPLMEDMRFYIPRYAPYLEEYLRELMYFPNAAHDDMVDVTAYACGIAGSIRSKVVWSEENAMIAARDLSKSRVDRWLDEDVHPDEWDGIRPRGDGKNR